MFLVVGGLDRFQIAFPNLFFSTHFFCFFFFGGGAGRCQDEGDMLFGNDNKKQSMEWQRCNIYIYIYIFYIYIVIALQI